MESNWAHTREEVQEARLRRDATYVTMAREVGVSYPTLYRCLTDVAYVPYERTQFKFRAWLLKGGAVSPRRWGRVRPVPPLDEYAQGDT